MPPKPFFEGLAHGPEGRAIYRRVKASDRIDQVGGRDMHAELGLERLAHGL